MTPDESMTWTVLWVVYLILAVPVTGVALFGALFDYTPRRERTSAPVASGRTVVSVGLAISTSSLVIEITQPILL
jgi:hypothetical protein